MKFLVACAALFTATTTFARPVLIHETQRLLAPDSQYEYFGTEVAVDGDWAIITAVSYPSESFDVYDQVALLYRRSSSGWGFVRELFRNRVDEANPYSSERVVMANGYAAISLSTLRIFQRSGSTWTPVAHPFNAPPNTANWVSGSLLQWSGSTLAAVVGAGSCFADGGPFPFDWGVLVGTRAANGTWPTPQRLSSGDIGCAREIPVALDIDGNSLAVGSEPSDYLDPVPPIRVYSRSTSGWQPAFTLPGHGGEVALRGDEIFVATSGRNGTLVYRNDASQTVVDNLRSVGALYLDSGRASLIRRTSDAMLQRIDDMDRAALVVNAHRKTAAGSYEHAAILSPRGNGSLGNGLAASGRRVLAGGYYDFHTSNTAVYAFDLPASFDPEPIRQHTFESGNANGWTPAAGSQFAVASTAGNRIYRQSSLAGDSRSVLETSEGTDQAIEANIRPTAFSGNDRWVGLAVRYVDSSNYYYVTLRSSGTIQLRRIVDGTFSTLAQRALPVTAGTNYRVHLQALGENLRVYVDGRLLLWAEDAELPAGRVALVGYKTSADFDNVLVEDIGQSSIYEFRGNACAQFRIGADWTTNGGAWTCDGGPLLQTSLTGDARAVTGVPTDDQVVSARVRATSFAAPAGTQERWFGLTTRYRNTGNYYYLSLRSSNQVSLRKLVNGNISVLRSAPLTVTPGSWYDLKLESIGNQVRGYVNGTLVVQATDSSHASGQSGAVTYKSAAEYDGFLVYQP